MSIDELKSQYQADLDGRRASLTQHIKQNWPEVVDFSVCTISNTEEAEIRIAIPDHRVIVIRMVWDTDPDQPGEWFHDANDDDSFCVIARHSDSSSATYHAVSLPEALWAADPAYCPNAPGVAK